MPNPIVKSTSEITWAAVPNADSYDLAIGLEGQDANIDDSVHTKINTPDALVNGQEVLDAGVTDGTYWLQVRAKNTAGNSPYSDALLVDVQAVPDKPGGITVS